MTPSRQSRRLLCQIAGLSGARSITIDFETLAARSGIEPPTLKEMLRTLRSDGLIAASAFDGGPREYRLTMAGWDIADDLAAVDPRADLDEKQREYSQATAVVSQFFEPSPSRRARERPRTFAEAVAAEDLARHRYRRAVERYLERQKVAAAAR